MKKFFRYLAAAVLAGTSFAAVSCSDDPEPAPIPEFPTPLQQQAVMPGDSYSFTIKPNMDWVVSIPAEARNWFYLDDNGTKVSSLRGAAVLEGGQPITVKVGAENGEPFDEEPTVEVTMTMGDPAESRTIASFVIRQMARDLKFYPALVEEGEYLVNEDESSPLQYRYGTEAKKEGTAALEKHGAFYSTRLLVESNVSWTLSVPEWVDVRVHAEAATSGSAGLSEVELRANYAKMPLEGAKDLVCPFSAQRADGSVETLAQITVSLEDLTGLLECERLPAEALFSPAGNYLVDASRVGIAINGTITAPDGAKVIALPKAAYGGYDEWMGQPWVTAEIDPWSGEEKIQTRNVAIRVAPQAAGAVERKADLFVLPVTLNDKTMYDLLTEDCSAVREEYQKYFVTTVTQEASNFLFNANNSLAMKEQGVNFELGATMFDSTLHRYCDWMHNDYDFYYKLTYTNAYSADGGALDVVPVSWGPKNYASYKIYGYNAGSAGGNLPADNKWIKLQEKRNAATNAVESFTVQMNFDEEYVQTYGDWSKKYAVVVFYDEDNNAIATLECEYDENALIGGGEAGAVSFAYPEYAPMEGSEIKQLAAGDADYDKYAAAYADFTPSVYRVTFRTANPTMSTIKGLPANGGYNEVIDGTDWLIHSEEAASEFTFAGLMNSEKSATGAYIFYTEGAGFDEAAGKVIDPKGPAVILVIDLKLE